tara:strand:- start:357 stop:1613 length:1257 start_codon:yes stop_codon:yes gene_type:complete
MKSKGSVNYIFFLLVIFIAIAIAWVSITKLDTIIRADGIVEPEQKVQTVQTRFNSKLEVITAKVGDEVSAGDVLAQLNDLDTKADLEENLSFIEVLIGEISRLKAEYNLSAKVEWPSSLDENLLQTQEQLFYARMNSLNQEQKLLKQEEQVVEAKINELKERILGFSELKKLREDEKDIYEPLVADGVEPKARLVSIKLELQKLSNDLSLSKKSLVTTQLELTKTKIKQSEIIESHKTKAFEELALKQNELRIQQTKTESLKNRLEDSTIRSPINGVVTNVFQKGPGAIVKTGDPIVEVAPYFDNIIVKANLRPQDITDVNPGQKSKISLSSYDFTVYGSIEGFVDKIARNTTTSENGDVFYAVWIKSKSIKLSKSDIRPTIFPGMTAQIEIIGKKRSILEYIMKPVLETKSKAFTEM